MTILIHAGLASLALMLGPLILRRPKGDRRHRAAGYLFATAILGTNVSAFFIYELTGGLNFIHALAVINLATLGHALLAVRRGRIAAHMASMAYCYAGLAAALLVRFHDLVPLPWPLGFAAIVAATMLATEALLRRYGAVPAGRR